MLSCLCNHPILSASNFLLSQSTHGEPFIVWCNPFRLIFSYKTSFLSPVFHKIRTCVFLLTVTNIQQLHHRASRKMNAKSCISAIWFSIFFVKSEKMFIIRAIGSRYKLQFFEQWRQTFERRYIAFYEQVNLRVEQIWNLVSTIFCSIYMSNMVSQSFLRACCNFLKS